MTETSAHTPRCVVIGAGIVGASCAWHLVRSGAKVTLVDPEPPGTMTSFGNCGCVSPSAVIPFSYPGVTRQVPKWLLDPEGPLFIRWRHLPSLAPWLYRFWRASNAETLRHVVHSEHQLMQHVIADYDQVLGEIGAADLKRSRGVIILYDTEAEFEAVAWQYRMKSELGLEWRRLSAAELAEREPHLRLAAGGVAVYMPDWDHLVDPGAVTARIAEAALADGAEWVNEPVTAVQPGEKSATVTTATGRRIEADRVVLAAGVWSGRLSAPIDGPVPLEAKRGYHSMVANPGLQLNHPVQSSSRFFVMTPMAEGLRIAGTAEFASIDAEPDYRRARVLLKHLSHYVPGVRIDGVTEWMGRRPMTPDSLPVIGPSPSRRSVVYAFGHGHYGLTQGPTTGRIVADLVFGRDPGIDLAPYRYDRF